MANNKDFVVDGDIEINKDSKLSLGTITDGTVDLSTGNYFKHTLSGNTTYVFSNPKSVQTFQLEVTGVGAGYTLSNAAYSNKSLSVTNEESSPRGITFNGDGTKLYLVGTTADSVFQYSLSTPYDVSTGSYDSVSKDVSSETTSPEAIRFNNDGTKMFILGGNDDLFRYSLSTAYDISTASYDSVLKDLNALFGSDPQSISFSPDGTKMYAAENGNDTLEMASMSTPFDIANATDVRFKLISGTENILTGMDISEDGTKAFAVGLAQDKVFEFIMTTPFDVASSDNTINGGVNFSFSSQSGNVYGITFRPGGSSFYLVDLGNDTIFQYSAVSATEGASITWPTSIKWSEGVAPTSPGPGETDIYTFTTDDGGTSYIGVQSGNNLS